MRISEAIGNGLVAGAAVPARATAKVLGVEPREQERFASVVHWGYGTGWGTARGLIGALGIRGRAAAALFFALVWTAER